LEEQLRQANDPDEMAALEADLHMARVDIKYAQYFPHMERYVSLYPAQDNAKADEEGSGALKRPPLWGAVEKAMKQGQDALERLRERRLGSDSRAKPPPQRPSRHSFGAKVRGMKAKHEEQIKAAKPAGNDAGRRGDGRKRATEAGREPADSEPSNDSDGSEEGGFFEED
jgi:hypothetical protein